MKALAVAALLGGCVAGNPAPDAAVAAPDAPWGTATMAPATQSWGTCSNFSPCVKHVFTVTAAGGSTPALETALAGTDAGQFMITADTCAGRELATAMSCTIEVAFTHPVGFGPRTALLQVTGGAAFTASSTLTAEYQSIGDLAISGSPYDFGMHTVGTTSPTHRLTITNSSSFSTGTMTVTTSGSDPTEFTVVADGCGGHPLAGFAMCTIDVAFAPASAGAKQVSFQMSANPGGTVGAVFTGTGN